MGHALNNFLYDPSATVIFFGIEALLAIVGSMIATL